MSDAIPTNQILVFKINNELYGIDILKVQEILNFMQPSPIPNCRNI
ncbi:chemotaxis protein CheW [Brachyspira hyodysenteriae]|nr:chemotaxis protein CheW [Brachyspira hyodysenteriae]MDA1468590.1 chemotaxis protein CheW [Brachyspira hyodysenteriae]